MQSVYSTAPADGAIDKMKILWKRYNENIMRKISWKYFEKYMEDTLKK